MMVLSMPMPRAPSVPGRTCSHTSALAPSQVRRGSMEMILVPICMHSTIQWPKKPSALDLSGSLPHTMMTSGRRKVGSAYRSSCVSDTSMMFISPIFADEAIMRGR